MSAQIWKIQRALFSSSPNPPVLIYNKDQTSVHELPEEQAQADHWFSPREDKVYVFGEVEDGRFLGQYKCRSQPW